MRTPSAEGDGPLALHRQLFNCCKVKCEQALDTRRTDSSQDSPGSTPLLRGLYSLACSLLALAVLQGGSPGYSQTADSFAPGANGPVYTIALQPDGSVILGGTFTLLGGQTRSNLGRVDANGLLDISFNPAPDGEVDCLAVQPDGRILVAGYFHKIAGSGQRFFARLETSGALDATFSPSLNGYVLCVAFQPDGKLVVGGSFSTFNGQTRTNIVRLNPDGTTDTTFTGSANSLVSGLALQPDGKVVISGYFTAVNGQTNNRICRLNADGTLDPAFNASADNTVRSVTLQPDGRILLLGDFASLNGQPQFYIGRLNANGQLDTSFTPNADSNDEALVLQADGRMVLGGPFTALNGQPCPRLGRLNGDGSFDQSFNPGADAMVTAVALQPDGKVLAGGMFTNLGGQVRNYIGRVNNTDAASESLTFDGTTVNWQRGGTCPELLSATFDFCTNGSTWFGLTSGQRVPSGWQGTPSGASASATVRAHGLVAAAHANYGRSTWFIESSIGPPAISTQPLSRTNNAGDLTTFRVFAAGDGAMNYQWFKNGVLLIDSSQISGSQSPVLTLSNILAAEGGGYSVVITKATYAATSQVATLTVIDPCIIGQPPNQAAAVGQSASFTVAAAGTPNLYYQWRKAGVAISGATGPALNLTNVQRADATTYDVVVTNSIGSVTSSVCNLTVNQVTADSLNPGADNYISTIAVQPDGKVLLGGMFLNLAGVPHSALGRLNADGTVDANFAANATAQYFPQVNCFAIQSNGFIVVGGYFTGLNGQPRTNLARLKANGTLDAGFNLPSDAEVMCLAAQPDGQVLVGGYFTNIAGHLHTCLARISSSGVVDDTFSPSITTESNAGATQVNALAVQPDGKILLGGWFTNLCGQSRWSLGRLNPDGTLDSGFTADALGGAVYCITLQADGKILVGGQFTSLAGQTRNGLARLYPDGTLDADFAPPINSYGVFALAVQVDGKILVGGGFTNITGLTGNCIERLNPDGSYDTLFNPQPDNWIYSIAVQQDGGILVGGSFQNVAGQARSRIARLNNTDVATQSLSCDGASITWMRSGTCPEAEFIHFDVSTNGNDLFSPGTPFRIPGGWELTGLALPTNVSVRARAFFENNSSWYSEATAGAPFISLQPSSLSTNVYSTVLFSVAGGGAPPLSYLWLKGGVPLANSTHISGANTANLTVNNVLGPDAGAYNAVLSNQFGSITSVVASLTVQDPVIIIQPVSQIGNLGLTSVFNVSVAGTAPFSYQWRKAGAALAGATASSLRLQNVQIADEGNYDVIVTNAFGSITSTVATLTVNTVLADGFNSIANSTVYCLVPQPDGKVLAGGIFSSLGGQPRSCLGRLTASGALDSTFHPTVGGGFPASAFCLFVQEDGKIVVGGTFTNLAGQACTNLGRLNFDGSADPTFRPQPNFAVSAVAVQSDGKLVVGGKFTTIAGQTRLLLARLNSDGALDSTFNPGASGGFNTINALAVQSDGRIIVGGDFTTLGGVPRSYLGRLNPSGSFDFTFSATPNAPVACLALQPDGKILVGGAFTNLNTQVRRYIARLNANGTLDTNFNPSASNGVNCFALQADGKIIVGGSFTNLAGQIRNCIGRLNPDGTPDLVFEPQTTGAVSAPAVYSLALQSDGNVLVGGFFATIAGISRNNIARLLNTDPATNTLSFDGANIFWLRGGTSPEVLRATFEWSANGTNWSSLGFATRIAGGWQLTNAPLPAGTALRAAALVPAARNDDSAYFVETTRPALAASAVTQGQFGFNLIGSPGQVVIIEGSFDLQTWTPLSTNTVGSGPLSLTEQLAPGLPARFYRARLP